jgi:putative methionine-R-sulfoxide reductase with GAF domain
VSEITGDGMQNVSTEFNINAGCAGIAFRTKKPVFESNIKEDAKFKEYPDSIYNAIAAPIFNEKGDSIGVLEILNSEENAFSSETTKTLLVKYAKYVSLIFYSNDLLKVRVNTHIEYIK